MTKKYQIEIPEEALEQTDFQPGDRLALSVNHKQIDVRPSRVIDQLPQIAFWWYALPAAVATLVFYAFFRERNTVRPIPLTGGQWDNDPGGDLGADPLYHHLHCGKGTPKRADQGLLLAQPATAGDRLWINHDLLLLGDLLAARPDVY